METAVRISSIGSERATGGHGNKIVTFDGKTHVVWQDISRKGYLNQVRSFDHRSGDWSDTVTLNIGVDNHARPVITVDSEGYLHVVLSGHGSPVTYRRSAKPNDTSTWTDEVPAGAGTYPVLICSAEGRLYFTVRAGDADGVDLYTRPKGGSWSKQKKLTKRSDEYRMGYAAFHNQLCLGADGALHFVGTFYEGTGRTDHRGIYQAVCYMKSPDCGETWYKSDGTPVELPAGPEGMDVLERSIEQRHEPMPPPEVAMAGVVATKDNRVDVFYISHREEPGQLTVMSTETAGTWTRRHIPILEETYPDMRPLSFSFTARSDGSLCGLATLAPFGERWSQGKPTRSGGEPQRPDLRLVWLLSDPELRSFKVRSEIEPGTVFITPTIERSTGANQIPSESLPSYLYYDGTSQYPGGLLSYFDDVEGYVREGELITNNVYWVPSVPQKDESPG